MERNDILQTCINAAMEAGVYLRENFGLSIDKIERKEDSSYVTNLDKESERMIVSRIKDKFPGHGIIGEEGGSAVSDAECIWIIDPLDGTHNFIRGMSLFGVSIGVSFRDEFVAGVIYMPVQDELYTAEKGGGAFKNGKPIRVSNTKDFKNCTVSFDSDIRTNPDLKLRTLKKVALSAFNIRMFGSSVRHLTYLAEGKLDAVLEFHDKPWDFAGGACLVQEAGGKITALDGNPLTYRHNGFIATNGLVQEDAYGVMSE